jgi:LytS/YehU family sensor histidine kinase
MRFLRWTWVIAALLGLSAPAAPAQQRMRVTLLGAGTQTIGTLHSATDTSLTLSTATGLLAFSSQSIARIEQSAGRQPNIPVGIAGLLLGAAAGGAIGCAANADSYGVFCGGQDDTKVIIGASAGALAGGLAGALLFRRERWRTVQLPLRVDF